MNKIKTSKFIHEFYGEKPPTYDGLFEALQELKEDIKMYSQSTIFDKTTLTDSEQALIKSEVESIISFLNSDHLQYQELAKKLSVLQAKEKKAKVPNSDRRNEITQIEVELSKRCSLAKTFKAKRNRKAAISTTDFLSALIDYLIFKKRNDDYARKEQQFYREAVDEAFKEYDYARSNDHLNLETHRLHDLSSLIIYDSSLAPEESKISKKQNDKDWHKISCFSISQGHEIVSYLITNVLLLDFIDYGAFKKSFEKYRKVYQLWEI